MIRDLTDEQIEKRLDWVELQLRNEKDSKNLPYLNSMFQKLISEQARRDVEKGDRK